MQQDQGLLPVPLSRTTRMFLCSSLTQCCFLGTGGEKPEWKPHCPSTSSSPEVKGTFQLSPTQHRVERYLPKDQLDCPTAAGGRWARGEAGNTGLPRRHFAPSKTELINRHLLLSHSQPLIFLHLFSLSYFPDYQRNTCPLKKIGRI